jgi:hypothetical protein
LIFLEKKGSGAGKGHGCADRRKQHAYMTTSNASMPTVAIESLMISCVIDAMEKCDIETADTPDHLETN